MLSPPLIERPILWTGGGYAGTMRSIMPNVLRPRDESPTPLMRLALPLLGAAALTFPFVGFADVRPWLAMLAVALPLAAWQARRARAWVPTLLVSIVIAFAAGIAGAIVAFLTHDFE